MPKKEDQLKQELHEALKKGSEIASLSNYWTGPITDTHKLKSNA